MLLRPLGAGPVRCIALYATAVHTGPTPAPHPGDTEFGLPGATIPFISKFAFTFLTQTPDAIAWDVESRMLASRTNMHCEVRAGRRSCGIRGKAISFGSVGCYGDQVDGDACQERAGCRVLGLESK